MLDVPGGAVEVVDRADGLLDEPLQRGGFVVGTDGRASSDVAAGGIARPASEGPDNTYSPQRARALRP